MTVVSTQIFNADCSTGGIIALGLTIEEWSVQDCIDRFLELCRGAFTPRGMHRFPGLKQMSAMNHEWSWYKTKPIVKILQSSFSNAEQRLFGGGNSTKSTPKVAVVAATDTFETPVVMANYNRPVPGQHEKREARSTLSSINVVIANQGAFQQLIDLKGLNTPPKSFWSGKRM